MAETIRGEDKWHPGNMCLTAIAFGVAHIYELTQTVFLCQRG